MDSKFALHNFAGTPKTYFLVEGEDLGSTPPTTQSLTPSHHIVVLDVSGSMYYTLAEVKTHLEKVFTIEEFNDPNLKVSLVTYSSHGDCKVHFERATVAQVMAANSPQLAEIRNLRVRGLTGISQGLVTAEGLVDDNDVTAITLMSDGCANDPSPYTESHNIDAAIGALTKHPNLFVNSIAYGSWADFGLLDAVSSKLSGKTVKAASAKDVYQAVHDTTALLAGGTAPTIEAGVGNYDFITFVSHSAEKVLGSTETLNVRGIKEADDKLVFRYREVSEADFNASKNPVCGDGTVGLDPVLAYCRAQIARGALNQAKFALISTRTTDLISAHYKAMTPDAIAEMAQAVEQHLFQPTTGAFTQEYGLGATGPSVLSVLGILNDFRSGFLVNLNDLLANYKRIGVKRIPGTREDDGTITPPKAELKVESTEWVDVSGIDINRANATANIRLVQDGTLIETATGEVVTKVEGIKLDLKNFRNYAIVADGSVNVPNLSIAISDKRLHAALADMGALEGTFDPNGKVTIALADLPLVDFDANLAVPAGIFERMAGLTVLSKILAGRLKEESEAYTPVQVVALKELHISPALYFSPPTTNAYSDLKEAIGKGEVDIRISYKVEVGTTEITNLGKLQSGNAYLQRRFDFTAADGSKPKPTLDLIGTGGAWALKSLSSRTKLTPVDALSFPIYEDFLGLGSRGTIRNLLIDLGYDAGDLHDAEEGIQEHNVNEMTRLRREVDAHLDLLFRQHFSPLAFYVGSTGLMPDNLDVVAMTADELTAKHPAVSLDKAEKEGIFYELPGGVLVTVYAKAEYFSTPEGLKAAKAA